MKAVLTEFISQLQTHKYGRVLLSVLSIPCLATMGMAAPALPGTVSPLANIAAFDFQGQTFEGDSNPGGFIKLNNKILFSAADIFGDTELYSYDGHTVQLLADINPGTFDENFQPKASRPSRFTLFGNEVVFSADDGVAGRELWSYDGQQVRRVADINQTFKNGTNQSSLSENVTFVKFRNELVFVADDGVHGPELWAYDGRQVRMIAEINAGGTTVCTPAGPRGIPPAVCETVPSGSAIGGLTVFGGRLVFRADNGTTGSELWVYDGQAVRQVANINQVPKSPSGDLGSIPGSFVTFGNSLYFGANDGIHGRELWAYDGYNVQMAPELRVGAGSTFSRPEGFIGVVFGDELFFSATNGVTGEELWSFNGDQYHLAADINQTLVNGVNQPSTVAGLTVFGGELVFAADDGVHGREAWSYAGGNARMLTDLNPSPVTNTIWHCPDWWPPDFPPLEDYCAFELEPTGQTVSSFPLFFTAFGNTLVFQANDGTSGAELWSYDHQRVSQVADINPGAGGSLPQGLIVFGNELIFGANDGVTGLEPWRLALGSARQ